MCFDKFFKNPFFKTKFAFSIIEILVALIVVSVILAALAPIITKRTQSSSITVTSTNTSTSDSSISDITTECQNNTNFSAACKLCTPNFA